MKTNSPLFIAIVLVGFCLRSPCYAQSTTVRGQLLRADGSPAASLQVKLVDGNLNLSTTYYTKADGMYYFYNVPLGNYSLMVLILSPDGKIQAKLYPISVSLYPYNDIQRVTVPDYVPISGNDTGTSSIEESDDSEAMKQCLSRKVQLCIDDCTNNYGYSAAECKGRLCTLDEFNLAIWQPRCRQEIRRRRERARARGSD
jgi:hypothetical protein